MPRLGRIDFRGALHYVVVRGAEGHEIFFDSHDAKLVPPALRQSAPWVVRFETLLGEVRNECGALLHAYCVEPNCAILVLRTTGAPLQAFMQRLCGRYARYLRQGGRAAQERPVFGARYDSKVVAPEYLPHVVRRAHRRPVERGLCKQPVDYPFSSGRAYCGETMSLRLDMVDARTALERKGYFGLRGYRDFMNQAETPYLANLLSHGSPLDSRIAGDKVFVQKARDMAAHPSLPPTREQIIAAISGLLHCSALDIFGPTRIGALGRTLVAWYGVRSGTATLTEIAQWFGVSAAALGQGIRHQRTLSPELFSLPELPGAQSVAGLQRH